ncbi:MAG: YwaF family protein [Clostridia bacterium]
MNAFENFLKLINIKMETPTPYGWFHFLWLAIMIIASIVVGVYAKKATQKQNKIFLISISLIMIAFEIYKQLSFSFNVDSGAWSYQWYSFPFQFCSVPMYVMLLAGVLKEGKFRDCLYSFLGTYGLFAGMAVMLMPGDVFTSTLGINIQTMLHHSEMFVVGIYILASGKFKFDFKTLLKGFYVFLVVLGMALILNIIVFNSGVLNGQTFNMFFISPYFPCTLFGFSAIYGKVPYVIFLLIYIIAFTLASYIVLLISRLISIIKKHKKIMKK